MEGIHIVAHVATVFEHCFCILGEDFACGGEFKDGVMAYEDSGKVGAIVAFKFFELFGESAGIYAKMFSGFRDAFVFDYGKKVFEVINMHWFLLYLLIFSLMEYNSPVRQKMLVAEFYVCESQIVHP